VTATGWRTLLAWAAAGLVIGWVMARLGYVARGEVASVPWSAALVLMAAGVALIFTAIRTRARLEGKEGTKRLPPLVGARLAALGVAASRVGAVVGGGYAGYAVFLLGDLTTDYRKQVVLRCSFCVLGAVVVVIGALLLERALRLPEDTDQAHLTT
jgi:Protein of unknown function (DUF3180)